MDGRTDGHNFDSNTVRCITCSRTVKTDVFITYTADDVMKVIFAVF